MQRDRDGNAIRGCRDSYLVVGRGNLDGEADDLPGAVIRCTTIESAKGSICGV